MTSEFPARGSVRGSRWCVAADHPLAASAGMAALRAGGTAADAAVAMAAVMTVVQPQFSHLGGDCFALVFEGATGAVTALNASGPAPAGAEASEYRALGGIPETGPLAVTVPGAVAGWWSLHQRFGRLPWEDVLAAATGYARDGFPASRGLALATPLGRENAYPGGYFEEIFGKVAGEGGQGVVQGDLARTFEILAAGGEAAFYTGEVAEACIKALNGRGATFTRDDWRPPARWADALSVTFAGHRVHSQPPPSQGFALLVALGLHERLVASEGEGVATEVLQVRAAAAAFGVRGRHAADPDGGRFDAGAWLRPAAMASLLERGMPALAAAPGDGDTTYMLAIDAEGTAVSLIQSLFGAWGSGVMVPGTGIILNNRMRGFTLKPGHPNELAAGRRPNHTLHSYLVTVDAPEQAPLTRRMAQEPLPATLRAVGGTPGADRQVQTNLQVIDRVLRRGQDPQEAIDAARWTIGTPAGDGTSVEVETRAPDILGDAFRAAGCEVSPLPAWGQTGKAYLAVTEAGKVVVGADLRGEGMAIVE